ncbi:MAG: hypothetical protein KDD04_02590 [Sinomicrobium sp.]|nr:hypothetical protein [Sinomicrobium sp.]
MKIILKEDDEALDFLKAEVVQIVKAAITEALSEVKDGQGRQENALWCNTKRAQEILGVKKTKMQQIRDRAPHNGIRLSRQGRTFRYYVPSLYGYLENHINK